MRGDPNDDRGNPPPQNDLLAGIELTPELVAAFVRLGDALRDDHARLVSLGYRFDGDTICPPDHHV